MAGSDGGRSAEWHGTHRDRPTAELMYVAAGDVE